MAKTRRRVLSILMALVLTLGLLPTAALAWHGGNTTIKVVDAQTGAPIQNAKVTVEHWFYGSGSTYTDPNGIAPFNLTPAYADYSVSVSAAGYQPGSGSVNAYESKEIRLTPDGSGGQATNGSDAYFYILKPNLTSGSYIPDATDDDYINLWDYVGKGKLNRGNPQYGDSKYTYTYNANEVETFPTMPSISYNGKTYIYEQSGTVAGTYQVTWVRFVDANGWNDGEKEYDSGKPTWHVDGYVTFCDVNSYQVTYTVIGENGGFPVHTEAVNSGVCAQGYTYTGYDTSRYEFKGWYTDKACTQAYDFQAPVTKNLNLYGKLVEKTYTPSVAPTATLTLTKKWDNVALGTDTVNISVGSVSKSVTVGQETKLTFEGLTPNQQYTITETPDNYLLDKNTITLYVDLLTGMTFNAIERYESCNNLTTEDLDGANAIVAALTGHQNDGYVVWTYQELSDNEKAAFVKAFLDANINGPYSKITVENTQFISGPSASYDAGNVIVNADNGTLTFGATKVWAQFVTGTYGYLYGGEGATVTNSPKVGDLTITSKTFVDGNGETLNVPSAALPLSFTVKNSAGEAVKTVNYSDLQTNGSVTYEDLPYGTYTIVENFHEGADGSFRVTDPNGTYSAPVLTVDDTGAATVAINAKTTSIALKNTYTFTADTEVKVSYAWTSDSLAWEDEFPGTADPLDATTYDDVTLITGEYGTQSSYAAPAVPTDTMPTGYSIDGWYVKSGDTWKQYTPSAATELVKSLHGGDSITLYAKLTDNMPTYKVKYDYYYKLNGSADFQQVKDSDGNAYVDSETAWATVSSRTAPAAQELYNSIKAGEITGVPASFTKEVGTAPSLTYSMASEWETGEVTSTGSLAAGDLVYTVKVYGQYYTVGSLTITKTIDLPRSETAAWNALKDTLTFTVTAELDSDEAFTPVTVSLKMFEDDVHSSFIYTYTLEDLKPGTYTVTENGADILSAYGYTWNAEDSVNSDEAVVTASGTPAVAALENVYDSREFTVIFDATLNGNVHNRNNTLIADGSSFQYMWFVPLVALDANTVSADPGWQGALDNGTFNNSQASQISYTFTIDDYKEFLNHNNFPIKISQPNVTADQGYTFTGRFTTTGTDTGVKFVDLETTMEALLESGQDQITYYANYSSSSGPIDPGPIDPGPIDPGPSDPGTDIPDDNTPTTDLPEEETPTTELPDEETPMTEEPVEELPDEDVPMAEVPATGDTAGLWALAAGVSGLALVWLALSGKKRREENA